MFTIMRLSTIQILCWFYLDFVVVNKEIVKMIIDFFMLLRLKFELLIDDCL